MTRASECKTIRARFVAYLRGNPGLHFFEDIAAGCNVNPGTDAWQSLYSAARQLPREGIVRRIGGHGCKRYAYLRELRPAGRPKLEQGAPA